MHAFMELVAAASSTPSAWRRSVRRRRTPCPAAVGRRVRDLETAVEELREEKDAAEAEEAVLWAELEAERAAAASEAMLMIERLQREKAAALVEARQYRRLAEGRAERDRALQDELAALSVLVGDYLSLLYAHGIGPDNRQTEERFVPDADGESGAEVVGSAAAAATKGVVAASVLERVLVVDTAADLRARVEALEADMAATRAEEAAVRAEPAQVVLAREMARRLRQTDADAETRPRTITPPPRFSVVAICKWLLSIFLGTKKSSTSSWSMSSSSTAAVISVQYPAVRLPDP